jgi:regulatory protein
MKILKFQKNKIYLENDEIIDINRDIKAKYKIKTDGEISVEDYKNILYESALSKSYFLLSMRDYTTRDLIQKLKMKYRRSSTVDRELNKVMEKLSELGYLDDYSYTESYINRKKNLGRKRIEFELHIKGIDSKVIDEVYEKHEEIDEKEEIRALLHKVRNKDENKQIAYFMRRGFKFNDILEVIKSKN